MKGDAINPTCSELFCGGWNWSSIPGWIIYRKKINTNVGYTDMLRLLLIRTTLYLVFAWSKVIITCQAKCCNDRKPDQTFLYAVFFHNGQFVHATKRTNTVSWHCIQGLVLFHRNRFVFVWPSFIFASARPCAYKLTLKAWHSARVVRSMIP